MGRYWWITWIKVGVALVFAGVLILVARHEVNKRLSKYAIEAPAENAKFYEKLDLENLVFDFANSYAQQAMEESDAERNVIRDHIS